MEAPASISVAGADLVRDGSPVWTAIAYWPPRRSACTSINTRAEASALSVIRRLSQLGVVLRQMTKSIPSAELV